MVNRSEIDFFDNLSHEVKDALGKAVKVEFLMHLIAESSNPVQDRLRVIQEEWIEEKEKERDENIEKSWTLFKRALGEYSKMPKNDRLKLFQKFKQSLIDSKCLKQIPKIKNYRSCKLSDICSAIIQVFKQDFKENELGFLKHACQIRNSFAHGDFFDLMKKMGIDPTGRERDGRSGKYVVLKKGARRIDALWGAKSNEVIQKAGRKIEEAIKVLECIATEKIGG